MPKKNNRKKENRRNTSKFPELEQKYALKTRVDLVDQDYLHKLNDDELEWLNKFNKEYVSASLDESSPKKNLHRTKKLRKECYDRNNSRNRDILTREKASNQLIDYMELGEDDHISTEEDDIINKLDDAELEESVEWLFETMELQKLQTSDQKAFSKKAKSRRKTKSLRPKKK